MSDVVTKQVPGLQNDIFIKLLKRIRELDFIKIKIDKDLLRIYFENKFSFFRPQYLFRLTVYQVDRNNCDVVFYFKLISLSGDWGLRLPYKIINNILSERSLSSTLSQPKNKKDVLLFRVGKDEYEINVSEFILLLILLAAIIFYFMVKKYTNTQI